MRSLISYEFREHCPNLHWFKVLNAIAKDIVDLNPIDRNLKKIRRESTFYIKKIDVFLGFLGLSNFSGILRKHHSIQSPYWNLTSSQALLNAAFGRKSKPCTQHNRKKSLPLETRSRNFGNPLFITKERHFRQKTMAELKDMHR